MEQQKFRDQKKRHRQCPIISNVEIATYKTTEYVATFFLPLTSSKYNIKTTYRFVKSIKNTKTPYGFKIAVLKV